MKRITFSQIIIGIAVLSLITTIVSCSNDDDTDKVSEKETISALFEMKKDYVGTLKYGEKDKSERLTLNNVSVQSAKFITISIPLDPIAEQMENETVASKIREFATAQVQAKCEFYRVEPEYFGFRLSTEMVADERFAHPLTRTQQVEYEGLTLLFDQTFTGEYQKYSEALSFNICIAGILINHEYIKGFKPVIFRFEGNAKH